MSRRTTPPTRARSWSPPVATLAPRMRGFRLHDVIAEIKPHTPGGINAGVTQLKSRASAIRKSGRDPRTFRYHLVTYRQVDGDPSRYDTYVSDPRTVDQTVFGSRKPDFLKMSAKPLHVPRAVDRIAVYQCPTMLGNALEDPIRRRYAAWMRLTQGKTGFRLEAKTSAQQTGADIKQRELVAFLRELAAELEAEI
ncbi:hypothetical protein [Nocardioides sp.]|uniref:hypothetical protein n=1 Tax=Nocardioides sp. TaxID=35761 RepID=UPI002D7EE3AA|nr:hypothetical protein [Nocardioides sp.]HET8960646.1 hypothetical protein [Nocardioides sp.]